MGSWATVRLLGPIEIGDRTVRGGTLSRILAMLAGNPNRPVPTESLIEAAWPEGAPPSAQAALRNKISVIRRLLGDLDVAQLGIERRGDAYELTAGPDDIDAVVFERRVSEERVGDTGSEQALLSSALALWRGEPFDGLDVEELRLASFRLYALKEDAEVRLIEARLALGEHASVTPQLESLVANRPEDERLLSCLMRSLYCSGAHLEALERYRVYRIALADRGLLPGPRLADLESAILRHDPALLVFENASPVRTVGGLPPSLEAHGRVHLADRVQLLGVLEQWVNAVKRGEPVRAQLLLGGPGIGKTALAAAVGEEAVELDVRVIHGWADPEGDRALAPIVSAFSAWRGLDRDATTIFAEFRRRLDDILESAGGPASRPKLLDVADQAVDALVRQGPTILVLDDLHWTDSATLSVISAWLHRTRPGLGILIVARPDEASAPWSTFMGEAARLPLELIELAGLSADAIEDLMVREGIEVLPRHRRRVVQRLLEVTGGNPYFVRSLLPEIARRPDEQRPEAFPDLPEVPATLAASFDERFHQFSESTIEALAVLANAGPALSLDFAHRLLTSWGSDPKAALADGLRSRLLVRQDRDGIGYRFEHELARAALARLVPPPEMARVHEMIAATARSTGGELSLIAHHSCEAMLRTVDPDPELLTNTLSDLVAASEEAQRSSAWREAYRLSSRGCDLATRGSVDDPVTLVRLHLGSARALQHLGERSEAISEFRTCLEVSQSARDPDLSAEVAVAASQWGEVMTVGDELVELLRSTETIATRMSPSWDTLVTSELVIQHAAAYGADDAIMAKLDRISGLHQETTDAAVALQRAWLTVEAGSPDMRSRHRRADDLVALTEFELPLRGAHLEGLFWKISAHLAEGRPVDAERWIDRMERLASDAAFPNFAWLARVSRADVAQQSGRLDESNATVLDAQQFGTEHAIPDALASFGCHMMITSWLVGELDQAVEVLGALADEAGTSPYAVAGSACYSLALASSEQPDEAKRLLAGAVGRAEANGASMLSPFIASVSAQACVDLDCADLAPRCLALLEPYSGLWPRSALVGSSLGPADRLLGQLHLLAGERAHGSECIRSAHRQAQSARARPWIAWCHALLAELDPADTTTHVAAVREIAGSVGLAPLLERLPPSTLPR